MGEEVNATVLMGRPVELRCQSDAIPPPTLTWRKDGRPLYRRPGTTVSEDGSLLKVHIHTHTNTLIKIHSHTHNNTLIKTCFKHL